MFFSICLRKSSFRQLSVLPLQGLRVPLQGGRANGKLINTNVKHNRNIPQTMKDHENKKSQERKQNQRVFKQMKKQTNNMNAMVKIDFGKNHCRVLNNKFSIS